MTGSDLLFGMGFVSDALVNEAEETLPQSLRRPGGYSRIVAAASIILIIAVALLVPKHGSVTSDSAPADSEINSDVAGGGGEEITANGVDGEPNDTAAAPDSVTTDASDGAAESESAMDAFRDVLLNKRTLLNSVTGGDMYISAAADEAGGIKSFALADIDSDDMQEILLRTGDGNSLLILKYTPDVVYAYIPTIESIDEAELVWHIYSEESIENEFK